MSDVDVPDAVESYRIPQVVRLGPNLFGAAFFLMKLVPARHILRRARATGAMGPDTVVVETTSGTFGLGLALECALIGNPLLLVGDPVIDARLRRQVVDLGARVEIVTTPEQDGGIQAARLNRLAEIAATLPDHFCPQQYTNPANPDSYELVADVLADRVGQIDCLVGPVGSGGSMCGTVRQLRSQFSDLHAVAVDTHGSVLFGQRDAGRELRGLGNSLMPANLDHTVFDEVHWVGAAQAYEATRGLHRRHALFMGPTSGAAFSVARWWAKEHPAAKTVVMLPDQGHRYIDTVYDDEWLGSRGMRLEDPSDITAPQWVTEPVDLTRCWSAIKWKRRGSSEHLTTDHGLAWS